jgi:hypothetical protein
LKVTPEDAGGYCDVDDYYFEQSAAEAETKTGEGSDSGRDLTG